jgi:hypothetical protein
MLKKETLMRKKCVLKVMTDSKILKEALIDDFAVGYLMNNGLTEGPSGTRVSYIYTSQF